MVNSGPRRLSPIRRQDQRWDRKPARGVDGRPYRLSFVKPNGAADVSGRLLARAGNPLAAALTVGRKVRDINQGVRAGRTWKALLSR